MIPAPTVDDRLRRAFAPTQQGVVGLTDQLLEAYVGGEAEFERVGDRCVCRSTENGQIQEATVPLSPAAFRTILARVAALCNERSPNSVTPYGGEGVLSVNGHSPMFIQVAFINTPDKQQLRLKSLTTELPQDQPNSPIPRATVPAQEREVFGWSI